MESYVTPDWKIPDDFLVLEERRVDVWRIGREGWEMEDCLKSLDSEEKERASRFTMPLVRQRFVIFRAALRQILANYLEADPEEVRLTVGLHGKPALPSSWLHFNLSHSGDWMLLACARDAEIGIDLEKNEPGRDQLAIARRFFDPEECRKLEETESSVERDQLFLSYWTFREAILKAKGDGLARLSDTHMLSKDWSTFHFLPATGFVACAALIPGFTLENFYQLDPP